MAMAFEIRFSHASRIHQHVFAISKGAIKGQKRRLAEKMGDVEETIESL